MANIYETFLIKNREVKAATFNVRQFFIGCSIVFFSAWLNVGFLFAATGVGILVAIDGSLSLAAVIGASIINKKGI